MAHILVVDDDSSVQTLLVELLSEQGHTAETCGDGATALERLQQQTFDFLVLDLLLPEINGFTLIEKLRASPQTRKLPVLMMSGVYVSRNHREEMCEQFRVVDYLDKPLDIDDFLSCVHSEVPAPAEALVSAERLSQAADSLSSAGAPVLLSTPKTVLLTQTKPESGETARGREGGREDTNVRASWVDGITEQERDQGVSHDEAAFEVSGAGRRGVITAGAMGPLFGKLCREEANGALLLRRGRVKKIVYFANGGAYAVKSNRVKECLGQLLVRERLISAEQCQRSLELMRDSGRLQGEILVEMDALTEGNLAFGLELQKETKLFEIFRWRHGEYRFNPNAPLPEDDLPIEWQGPAVVTEGIRRTLDEAQLRELMEPLWDVAVALGPTPLSWDKLGLTPKERRAAAGFASPETPRTLVKTLPLTHADAMRLIYTLISLQILEPQV